MVWIDAVAHSAEMIKIETFGDRSDEQFIGETMRHHASFAIPESAIPTCLIAMRRPKPAIIGPAYLLPEALRWRATFS
jgi:hypothetical protein